MLLCCWLCKGSLRRRRLEVVGERENGRAREYRRGSIYSARSPPMQDSHAGEETRQARAREKTEKGKRLSVAYFSASTLSLESCQCRAPIVRFNRYSGTSPWDTSIQGIQKMFTSSLYLLPLLKGHLYSGERDTFSRSRHPGLTSIQGTP